MRPSSSRFLLSIGSGRVQKNSLTDAQGDDSNYPVPSTREKAERVTSRIFALVKYLSIDAILSGEEYITDDAIARTTSAQFSP